MFKICIYNYVEDKIVFHGYERDFIEFTKIIVKENEDANYSILGVSDAIKYIENFCDNLEIIN